MHAAAERRAPETLVDAKFSLPFLVALAAVHGTVEVAHFTETDFTIRGSEPLRRRWFPSTTRSSTGISSCLLVASR